MKPSTRTFEDRPAVRERVPLLLGLVGPSGSGKTFSALRLAAGIQRVAGGDVFGIDSEANRMLHYAERFNFRHVPFTAPFGPLDYLAAIEHCVKRGAKTIVVDSASHEHEGTGGVLEMHEAELDRLAGQDYQKRNKLTMLAWAKPKQQRRAFINAILQLPCNFIFCFRAKPKLKMVRGQDPVELGYMPIAGEEFVYEMVLKCLLLPGANGVPTWKSEYPGETAMMKLPEQFKKDFGTPQQLSEDIGERLARWAAGDTQARKPRPGEAEMIAAKTPDELAAVWAKLNKADQAALASLKDKRKAELTAAPRGSGPNGEYVHGVDDPAHAPQEAK